MNEKVINSIIGIYPGTGFHVEPTNAIDNSLKSITPAAVRVIMPAPKGPKGFCGWPEQAPGYEDRQLVSKNVKDPERLFKLIDWAFSDEGAPMLQFGVQDKDWTYNKETNTIKQLYKNLDEIGVRGFGNNVRFLQLVDRRWITKEGFAGLQECGKNVIKNDFWQTVPAMFDYPDLGKIWDEYFNKIVTGVLPLDAWDEFVQRYYQAGGKALEDQVNEAWKKTKK
jgi:putative aldouronate transport system substrate-binding protein